MVHKVWICSALQDLGWMTMFFQIQGESLSPFSLGKLKLIAICWWQFQVRFPVSVLQHRRQPISAWCSLTWWYVDTCSWLVRLCYGLLNAHITTRTPTDVTPFWSSSVSLNQENQSDYIPSDMASCSEAATSTCIQKLHQVGNRSLNPYSTNCWLHFMPSVVSNFFYSVFT